VGAGASSVTIQPPSTNVAAVSAGAGTNVTLQGLKLYGALGGTLADGVRCEGTGANRSTLVVVESLITDNDDLGVEATNCDVTLHRNRVLSNQGGGIKLADGKLEVVDNVLALNGTAGSAVGGAKLDPGTAAVTFVNNTLSGNTSAIGATAGLQCVAPFSVTNTIVWGNLGGAQQSGCSFTYSDVQGGASGTGNIDADPALDAGYKPAAAVFDKGTDTAATSIDIDGAARKKGAAVDIGAHEVQ
jgi:hypothetical protein